MNKKITASLCAAVTACAALCAPVSASETDPAALDFNAVKAQIIEQLNALQIPADTDLGMTFDFGEFDLGDFDFGELGFGELDFGELGFGELDFGEFDFSDIDLGALDLESLLGADAESLVIECYGYLQEYIEADLAQYLGEDGTALEHILFVTIEGDPASGKGDFNGNEVIEVSDAQQILTEYVESITGQTIPYAELYTADVDSDLALTVSDAQKTLLYYVSESLLQLDTNWDSILAQFQTDLTALEAELNAG